MHDSDDSLSHLNWAFRTTLALPESIERDRTLRHLTQAQARVQDPHLRLAVVGEFSSGKSTLLNALLDEELFPTSVLPTTGCVLQIRPASEPALRIRTTDDQAIGWHHGEPVEESSLHRFLRGTGSDHEPNLAGLIRAATTDPQITSLIASLVLEHPSKPLGDTVVLYDTPGTNDDEGRTARTLDLLANECDMVAVVTRADIPVSQTLSGFLEPIRARLGADCLVFIVTWIDAVEPDERQRVIRTVRSRIQKRLGISDPCIIPMAPKAYLRQVAGSSTTLPSQWYDHFIQQSTGLRSRIAACRSATTASRIDRSVDEFLQSVEGALDNESVRLEQNRRHLAGLQVQSSDSMVERARSIHSRDVDARWPQLTDATVAIARTRLDQLHGMMAQAIDACSTNDQLTATTGDELPKLVAVHGRNVDNELKGSASYIAEFVESCRENALSDIRERYRRLLALCESSRQDDDSQPLFTAVDFAFDLSSIQETLQSRIRTGLIARRSGMAIGAAIGTAIAPGVGTVAGGLIGRWLGNSVRPTTEQLRSEMIERLAKAIDQEICPSLERSLRADLEGIRSRADVDLDAILRRFQTDFERLYRHAREQQQAQLSDLDRQLDAVRRSQRELLARRSPPASLGEHALALHSSNAIGD